VVRAHTAATADAAGLLAVAGAQPATAFAAAGPGWTQAGVAGALTIAGLDHLTSLDLAVFACAGALSR
jgi:hypothetical protein